MDWKKECEEELRLLEKRRALVCDLKDTYIKLDAEIKEAKSPAPDGNPRAKVATESDEMLNNFVKRRNLMARILRVESEIKAADNALERLDYKDRIVLQAFYILPLPGRIERIMKELHVEERTAYKYREHALVAYCNARYGC